MKKSVSLLLALLICLSAVVPMNVVAVSNPTISIGSAVGHVGDTVSVEVSLQNNPGVVALQLQVSYDNTKLQLTRADDYGVLGTNTASFGNLRRVPFSLTWDDSSASSDHVGNGTIAVLTFTILDDAESGDTGITVSVVQGGTFNLDLDDVIFQTVNGAVTVQSDTVPTAIVTVGSVSAKAGDDIDVPIAIEDNPGLVAMLLSVEYDTGKIQLTGVTDGSIFGTGIALFGRDYAQVPYKLLWEDGAVHSNYTQNGTLATLHFHVLDSAESGTTVITLQYEQDSTFDMDVNEIPLALHAGQVTIEQSDVPPSETPVIKIEGGHAVTAGDKISLPITMQNNPGLVAVTFSVDYDTDILELIGAEAATDVFPSGSATMSNDLSQYPFGILFEDGSAHTNYAGNGTLVTLTFRAKKDAQLGDTLISLMLDTESTFNVDMDDVFFETVGSSITVLQKIPGDVNHDGVVNLKDAVLIRRWLADWDVVIDEFLADVDNSQTITLMDVVLITRYLAGGWGVILL